MLFYLNRMSIAIMLRKLLLIFLSSISMLPMIVIQGQSDTFDYTLRRIRVPILMYHYVSNVPDDADQYRVELTVEPDVFRTHMEYLSEQGYIPISLSDLDQALLDGSPLPDKPVILTFDDGHIDHYLNVFPILQEFGFTGTFFLITGRIDNSDAAYVTWNHVQEMADAGMQMEAHTKDHQDLRDKSYDYLVYQIIGSVESIAAHSDYQATMFAYPGGRYDAATLSFMESTGIRRAVTTENGSWHTTDNAFEMKRVRVSGNTSSAGLAYLLTTDWE